MPTRTVLATIAVATYEPPDAELAPDNATAFAPLPRAAASLAELAAFLRDRGFEEIVALPAEGAPDYEGARRALQRVAKRVRELAREGAVDVVLVWCGHGEVVDGDLRLATADSWAPMDGASGQSPSELARALPMAAVRQAVIVIESCHAGGGVAQMADAVARALDRRRFADDVPNLVVVASCQKDEKSLEGQFIATLLQVLRDGPSPAALQALAELGGGHWSPHNQLLTPSEVLRVVEAELDTARPPNGRQRPRLMLVDLDRPVFPNPGAISDAPDMLVEHIVRRAMLPEEAEAHFLPKARGLEPGEEGWQFTGRLAANQALVAWLANGTGLAVVTGGAGTGKSALLGRLAALSDAGYRSRARDDGWDEDGDGAARTVPAPDSIDAAVHARGRTRDQVAAEIGSILGLEAPPTGWSAVALITAQSLAGERPLVLVDALDESAEPEPIAKELLRPLVEGGWRVLVGTRPGADPATGREGVLVEALGQAVLTVDLGVQPDTTEDLTDYVSAQLRDCGEVLERAREVAESAAGSFLYARLVASSLRRRAGDPSWGQLPIAATVADAFLSELARLPGKMSLTRGVLSALAWAEGRGLPLRDEVWPRVAGVMTAVGPAPTRDDVERVLHSARQFVIESGEDGQAVYRLFHQELVDALRLPPPGRDELTTHAAIVAALRPRRDWFDANPYVARYLAIHAAKAGTLPELLAGDDGIDLDALAMTDPGSLRRAAGVVVGRLPLPEPASGIADDTVLVDARWLDAIDAVTSTQHVLDELGDPRDRVGALQIAVGRLRRPLRTRTRHRPDWRCIDTLGGAPVFRTTARVPAGQRWVGIWENQWGITEAVASGPRGLQTIPSGAWTAPSPVDVADHPLGLAPDGYAAAKVVMGHHPTPGGGGLRFKLPLAAVVDAGVLSLVYGAGNEPELFGPVPGICRTVAIGEIDGRTVVVTAADEVIVWWTDTREATPLGVQGWATHVSRGQVVVGGMDGTVKLCDPVQGTSAELPTSIPFVTGLASASIGGRPMLAACGGDGIELFDLDAGTSERWLTGTFVLGVDIAEVGTTGVLAAGLGRGSGQVRLWHLDDRTRSVTIEGHDGGVWAVRIVGDARRADLVSVDEAGTLAFTDLTNLGGYLYEDSAGAATASDIVATATGRVASGTWRASVGENGFLSMMPVGPTEGRPVHSQEPFFPLPSEIAVVDEGGSPKAFIVLGDGTVVSWMPPPAGKPEPVLPPLGRHMPSIGGARPLDRIVALDGRTLVVSALRDDIRVWDSSGPAVHTLRSPVHRTEAVTAGFLDGELVVVVADRLTVRVIGLDGALRRDPIPIGGRARSLDLAPAGVLTISTASVTHVIDLEI